MESSPGRRFFSSSLLLIYDAADQLPKGVDVRMIDFEHSTYAGFLDDPRHEGVDAGYIFGLTNLIRIFEDMLTPVCAV